MAKDKRLFMKLALDFLDHPKIAILSDTAFRCLVEAMLWSRKQERSGLLPRRYAVARWSLDALQELCCNDDTNPSLIERDDGWYIHDYAEHQETKADIEARRERNRIAGQKGGLAKAKRSAKRSAKRPASKVLSETLSENVADIDTDTEKETTTKTSSDPDGSDHTAPTDYPCAFEEWWRCYPRKDAKRKALEAWKRARKRAPDRELIDAAQRYTQDPNRQEQYTKQPATWLNGDCWLSDALPDMRTPQANGQPHKLRAVAELAAEVRAQEQAELEITNHQGAIQ